MGRINNAEDDGFDPDEDSIHGYNSSKTQQKLRRLTEIVTDFFAVAPSASFTLGSLDSRLSLSEVFEVEAAVRTDDFIDGVTELVNSLASDLRINIYPQDGSRVVVSVNWWKSI